MLEVEVAFACRPLLRYGGAAIRGAVEALLEGGGPDADGLANAGGLLTTGGLLDIVDGRTFGVGSQVLWSPAGA